MKIKDNNGMLYTLADKEKVGDGGEGTVYVKGDRAYKIWHDPANGIPESKLQELSLIKDKRVIKSEGSIYDTNGKRIGYWMPAVMGGKPLCTYITTPAQTRANLKGKNINNICKEMAEIMQSVHDANCLIVDANEMNWLLDEVNWSTTIIDTDAWQTPSHHATAIMASVRDPLTEKNNKFNKESDWYGWGIVTFQLWTGIHPFKGKEPKGLSFTERMRLNLSVFDSSVKVSPVVRDWSAIPGPMLDWYKDVFQNGKRSAPPGFVRGAVIQMVQKIAQIVGWKISNEQHANDLLGCYGMANGTVVAWSASNVYINQNIYPANVALDNSTWIITHPENKQQWFYRKDDKILDSNHNQYMTHPNAKHWYLSNDNTFFVVNQDGKIFHYSFTKVGINWVLTSKAVGETTPGIKNGVAGNFIHYLLGMPYWKAYLGQNKFVDVALKEIKGKKIAAWHSEYGNLILVTEKQGLYEMHYWNSEGTHTILDSSHTFHSPIFSLTPVGVVVVPISDKTLAFAQKTPTKSKLIDHQFPDNIFSHPNGTGSWNDSGWKQVSL